MNILCIDTGTSICSVALGCDQKVLGVKKIADSRAHSSQLTVLIEELLKELGFSIKDIDAVAINKGPGSYTGLRIGGATAKGICYALGKPLISVGSLEAMAYGMVEKRLETSIPNDALLCPMIDARRMEVYTAIFDQKLQPITQVEAKIIDSSSFAEYLDKGKMIFFGNGASKCKETISHHNAVFIDSFEPSAAHMLYVAAQKFSSKDFEDTAYFEPFYLKDFVAVKGKNKVLGDIFSTSQL